MINREQSIYNLIIQPITAALGWLSTLADFSEHIKSARRVFVFMKRILSLTVVPFF